jgi:hypothetical protein
MLCKIQVGSANYCTDFFLQSGLNFNKSHANLIESRSLYVLASDNTEQLCFLPQDTSDPHPDLFVQLIYDVNV